MNVKEKKNCVSFGYTGPDGWLQADGSQETYLDIAGCKRIQSLALNIF
jgi:hypothetical protein